MLSSENHLVVQACLLFRLCLISSNFLSQILLVVSNFIHLVSLTRRYLSSSHVVIINCNVVIIGLLLFSPDIIVMMGYSLITTGRRKT